MQIEAYDGPLENVRERRSPVETKPIEDALRASVESGKPQIWKDGANAKGARVKNAATIRAVARRLKLDVRVGTANAGNDLTFAVVAPTVTEETKEEVKEEVKEEPKAAPVKATAPAAKRAPRKATPVKATAGKR